MMQVDPLLIPILQNVSFDGATDVVAGRSAELATARRLAGVHTPSVPDSVTISDRTIGHIPVRVYTPEGARIRAALLFAHGGGWATGTLEASDPHCATMAADADVLVVSVDYRLVPENPFPAGLDDVTTALRWLAEHAAELGVDALRIAIGGESAGANLAAAVALRARDDGGPALALQLLEVPVLDLRPGHTESYDEVKRLFPDFSAGMDFTRRRYVAAGADPLDPLVSPLLANDLGGLPPALLLVAEVDPVRDDAMLYAERLTAAGVPARSRIFPGLVHGTEGFTLLLESAREWHAECVAALRSL